MLLTMDDVRAHHIAEAQRYLVIGTNWTQAAEAEARRTDGRPNGVRRASLQDAARAAVAIADLHTKLATACTPLAHAA